MTHDEILNTAFLEMRRRGLSDGDVGVHAQLVTECRDGGSPTLPVMLHWLDSLGLTLEVVKKSA